LSGARQRDEEPLTQLDVNIDTQHLDSLEGELSTDPGTTDPGTTSPGTDGTDPGVGADAEPQTMEPPRVLGVPRLRAATIVGVAPPSSGGKGPPTTNPAPTPGAATTPKKATEDQDEQTTLVGKLLAEAHAEVAKRLKERQQEKEPDLYADETATTVGDAEKLIAAANAAAFGSENSKAIEENDEPTESRSVKDALVEDVTSKRDAINIDSALARAAELRAEAERKKRNAAKKRTIHGLGTGPLTLPANPSIVEPLQEEISTGETTLDGSALAQQRLRESDKLVVATPVSPADGEKETLSVGLGQPAPMRSIGTEPETMPVQVPPTTPRGLGPGGHHATLLAGTAPPAMHANGPYTQPLPYAPTMRADENGAANIDPALRATANAAPGNGMNPYSHAPNGPHALPGTPPGGVPQYHSTPMPVPAPFTGSHPHAGPAAFARTAVVTGTGPALPDVPEKKGRGGLIAFLLLLFVVGGLGFWKRAMVQDSWNRYRHPPPAVTPSAVTSTTPPVATDSAAPTGSTAPSGATTASAAPGSPSASPSASASASAGPHGSASAAPSGSASSKPPKKGVPQWKPPPPPPPKPKPAAAPKPTAKPLDESRGF
jgi:hypothetical protein